MIQLGEHAETYIEHQARRGADHSDSLSHSEYDVGESRREWANSFQ